MKTWKKTASENTPSKINGFLKKRLMSFCMAAPAQNPFFSPLNCGSIFAPSGCTWYVCTHLFSTQKCGRAAAPPHCILACGFLPLPQISTLCFGCMVGSGWQKIKPWTVQPKQLYPVMSDIEIWGGASFIVNHNVGIFRVWCFCPSTAGLVFWIPKKLRVRCSGGIFGALLLAQLCLQPGHSRNWGVRWPVWSRTAKR